MGQKVNPIGIRLGITRDWTSKWYAGSKTFPGNIHTDHLVRKYLSKKLADASVSRIHIERAARRANITIHTARPGIVIGTSGNTRIQIRPPRLTWRDMARRAASISRAVMRQRSVAFKPYSPNATELPRCALPAILPLNCLRNLVRFGCIMCGYLSVQPAAGAAVSAVLAPAAAGASTAVSGASAASG